MKRRLSSLSTPFYKFTPIVLLAYGLFLLVYDFRAEALAPAVFFLLLFGVLSKLASKLKKVYLVGGALYVSNYMERVNIPLAEVASVEASSWWGWQPRTISLKLRNPCKFGEKIVFIPRWVGFLATEIADEIRTSIAAQHNNGVRRTRIQLVSYHQRPVRAADA